MDKKIRGGVQISAGLFFITYVLHTNMSSPTDFIELQMKVKVESKRWGLPEIAKTDKYYSFPASQLTNGVKG